MNTQVLEASVNFGSIIANERKEIDAEKRCRLAVEQQQKSKHGQEIARQIGVIQRYLADIKILLEQQQDDLLSLFETFKPDSKKLVLTQSHTPAVTLWSRHVQSGTDAAILLVCASTNVSINLYMQHHLSGLSHHWREITDLTDLQHRLGEVEKKLEALTSPAALAKAIARAIYE